MTVEMSATQCTRGRRRIEYAQSCTDTPGQVHPTGDHITLCPPEHGCDDAVMHREAGGDWHTCAGVGLEQWYREREAS